MNPKRIYNSTKNFVQANKTPLVVGTIVSLVTVVYVQRVGILSLNEFLEEKGLREEFFSAYSM